MEEIWKDVIGYVDIYQVSNLGRIRSFKNSKNVKIIKGKKDKDGYIEVGLRDNTGKRCFKRVHRLVAECFIPNTRNEPFINHKDNIVDNNCVTNLEWCTGAYNNKYKFLMGYRCTYMGEVHYRTHLSNEIVEQIYRLAWSKKYTQLEIAQQFNTTHKVVNKIKQGVTWKHVTNYINVNFE
jgi:hypothetical protein